MKTSHMPLAAARQVTADLITVLSEDFDSMLRESYTCLAQSPHAADLALLRRMHVHIFAHFSAIQRELQNVTEGR